MELDSDTLNIYLNQDDVLFTEQTEKITTSLEELVFENANDYDKAIHELRSNSLPTKLKTLFWRIVRLIIFEVEGKIPVHQFEQSVRIILMDFTQNKRLIEKLTIQVCYILGELKRCESPFTINGNVFHWFNTDKDDGKLRSVYNNVKLEDFIGFECSNNSHSALQQLLQFIDFGFKSRIQLALIAVITEVGFADFSTILKQEIYQINSFDKTNVLPVYRACFDFINRSTVSLCHRIYGTLSNKLYIMVKQFVDRLYY